MVTGRANAAIVTRVDGADRPAAYRQLVTGNDSLAQRLQAGLNETRRTGNLRGKPVLIVHGRNDDF